MTDCLIARREDQVLHLTLNRPDRLNAFDRALHAALLAALVQAGATGARAVLLDGAGRGFSAGQDLADLRPGDSPADLIEQRYNPLVRAIRALPCPVVCAVHGVAAGAGANIALACDIVLASEEARFLQAFINIGLIPDSGGTWLLPRLAGEARARGMAMLGEAIGGRQAADWGLIWRALPAPDLPEEALRVARRLASLPTRSIALIKRAFAAQGANSLDAQLDLERALQGEAAATPDYAEGVAAFLQKRAPRFTGGAA